jgi:hypothetical protein
LRDIVPVPFKAADYPKGVASRKPPAGENPNTFNLNAIRSGFLRVPV